LVCASPKKWRAKLASPKGMRVDVAAEDGRVVTSRSQPRYRLEDLLEGMTPEDMHLAFDWGPDVGREIIG
jgi:antitoxin component of MazEF toxin-antitoxin module